jgi:hypothetical protein
VARGSPSARAGLDAPPPAGDRGDRARRGGHRGVPLLEGRQEHFSGARWSASASSYRFTDNLNYREVERYVTRVEEWIQARKDSLHVKSPTTYFGNNEAITRAYLAPGWADDEGAQTVRKMLRAGLPELPAPSSGSAATTTRQAPRKVAVRLFGDPGPRLDALGRRGALAVSRACRD